MLLSNIVKLVNAKSFGETTYTYDEIYPYFLEAINAINNEVDTHRHIPTPPPAQEYNAEYGMLSYNAISDMHIANFIVTYIVVAMDNASLSVTNRTQTYASQLETYKRNLISELYRWMPITASSNNYFDFTNSKPTLGIPNLGRVWYDENEGGKLSSNTGPSGEYHSLPTLGVHCENPYGYLVPKDSKQRILEGTNTYEYIFYPFEYFRKQYTAVRVNIAITGYDIPYSIPVKANAVYDVGTYESLNSLLAVVWSVLKSDDGTPIEGSPSVVVGSHTDGDYLASYIFNPHKNGLIYTDTGTYTNHSVTKVNGEFVTESVVSTLDTISVNDLIVNRILKVLNDFSSYKVVFGHSIEEENAEGVFETLHYLMAVVKKDNDNDIIFGIDKNGRLSANNAYFTNASIFDAAIETLAAAIANIQTLDTANLTSNNATIQALEVDNKATIKELDADTSTIEELNSTNATILKAIINELLSAVKAQIDNAEINEANITEANVQDMYSDNATISRKLDVVGTANVDKLNARFVVADLIPDDDNTRNLGSVLKAFANVFANVVKATYVKIGDYYAITTKDKEELQKQIDGINAGQNLADIVGTFALLSVYDTANLKVNDKVQVLVDETKENDSTVYNWNGTSFEFVGSYGSNAYTKAEVDAQHLVLEKRMTQHEKDIAGQFDKHEEEVKEVVDSYKADIENYVDEKINEQNSDIIVYISVDDNGNVIYLPNYDEEELVEILMGNTPINIQTTQDNVNYNSYTFLSDTSYNEIRTFEYFEVEKVLRFNVNTINNSLTIVETINNLAIKVQQNSLVLEVYVESYNETTNLYTISTQNINKMILTKVPKITMKIVLTPLFEVFTDDAFNIFYKTGYGVYNDTISGTIFSNTKYDVVIKDNLTEMLIVNKKKEFENTIGNINSILDTLNGEVL